MMLPDQEDVHFIYWVNNGLRWDVHVTSFNIRNESAVNTTFFHLHILSVWNWPVNNQFPVWYRPKLHMFWWNKCLAIGCIINNELQLMILEKQQRKGNDKHYYKWNEDKITVPLI